jgi:hypothetical protein
VLHHTALVADPALVPEEVLFWQTIGFVEVPVPEALGDGYTWFEREGTQIHLIHSDQPTIPRSGHVAVVPADFQAAIERLRDLGFEVREGRRLWGAARAKVTSPAGHTIELMAAPPGRSPD